MKKTLVSAILGLAAIASVQAQGVVILYNYDNPSTLITYGAASGGTFGTGLVQGTGNPGGGNWTIGIYSVAGSSAAAQNAAMAGDGGYGLVTGMFLETETAVLIGGSPGLFGPVNVTTGTGLTSTFSGAGTFVLVAYNGANYGASQVRGHSAAFQMAANALPSTPLVTGAFGSTFAVVGPVPEPSTFALAGLGLAGLLIFRRRN